MKALYAPLLALLTSAAQAQTLDCRPQRPVLMDLSLSGVTVSWPCVIAANGFTYRWNRVAATWGAIPEVGDIVDALAAPDAVGQLNRLLGGRPCSGSAAVQALCDEARASENRSTASLPTLWQTRPAPWGGTSVYRLTAAGPDLSAAVGGIGRTLCDCAAYSQPVRADGSRLCQTRPATATAPAGVSFCQPAP